MSIHNLRFHREIRKMLCGYPLLSVAMQSVSFATDFLQISEQILTC